MSHKQKTKIPARYLRKPWFIILSHVMVCPLKYARFLDEQLTKSFLKESNGKKDLRPGIIKAFSKERFGFIDPYEKLWFEQGVDHNGSSIIIEFPVAYQIEEKYIAHLCMAINIAGNLGKPGLYNKYHELDGPKIDKSVTKGGLIQTEVHKKLSSFELGEDSTIVFGDLPLEMSYKTAEGVIDYAISILKDLYPHQQEVKETESKILADLLDLLKNSGEKGLDEINELPPDTPSSIALHHSFWQNSLPGVFEDSQWLCFERTDAIRSNGKAEFGIAIGALQFQKAAAGILSCEMCYRYYALSGYPDYTRYTGVATVGEDEAALHLELHRKNFVMKLPSAAFFTMTLNDVNIQNIMTGHHTYYATRFHKYLTKTVVWLKYTENDFPISPNIPDINHEDLPNFFKAYSKDLNPANDPIEFKEIPGEIRRFLSGRKLNRLSMPEKGTNFLKGERDSLEEWMSIKYKEILKDKILKICCIDYLVCFYYGNLIITDKVADEEILKRVRVDKLNLKFDENSGKFKATYIHRLPNSSSIYTGDVYRKSYSIEVQVSNDGKSNEHTTERNFISISFSIPNKMEDAFKAGFDNCKYFTGISSGLSDDNSTPISFSIMLFKLDKLKKNRKKDFADTAILAENLKADILRYFRSYSANLCLRPGPMGRYKSDLL